MIAKPINDLNKCSVLGCDGKTAVIIQKVIGEEKVRFGYCEFHGVISATLFAHQTDTRVEIHV